MTLATDYLGLDALLSAAELAWRDTVRTFVRDRIRPNITAWYESAVFPAEIVPEMGRLGLLGMHLSGYGCPGRSAVEYGLAALELEAGDSGLRTFVSVQGSLAMSAIHKFGTEAAEAALAARHGRRRSDRLFRPDRTDRRQRPGQHDHTAPAGRRRLGDRRRQAVDRPGVDRRRRRHLGAHRRRHPRFRRPHRHPGVHRHPDRAEAVHARLDPVRHHARPASGCPPTRSCPGPRACSGPFACLNEARYGIIWGAMGAARDAYEAALAYALDRRQFGKPIASFQLTQEKLVDMVLEIQKGLLVALHTGRMKDAGTLRPGADLVRQAQQRPDRDRHLPGRPGPSSAATASHWSTRRCGTPTTSRASAPTKAPTRCTS